MKIPFTLDAWLKDKSQKVETRNGRIVHNIWPIKEPIIANGKRAEVCALIDGEEDALVFFEGGRYLPTTKDTDNPFDLFIITPEPELSEFEQKVRECVTKNLTIHIKDNNEEILSTVFIDDDTAKKMATELLALAEREIVNRVAKECYKEDLCIEDTVKFDEGYKLGKEIALKDLPRWELYRKGTEIDPLAVTRFMDGTIGRSRFAVEDCYVLDVKDMLKLPGFKEDESHEQNKNI